MSDSPETTADSTAPVEVTPTAQPAPAEPAKPAERSFTQTELDSILTKRLAKERERTEQRIRSELAAKQTPTPKQETPKAAPAGDERTDVLAQQVSTLTEQLAAERHARTFAERVTNLDMTDKQRSVLKTTWDPDAPDQFESMLDAFGIDVVKEGPEAGAEQPAEAAPANAGPEAAQPKKPEYVSPGAPGGEPEGEHLTDASKWTAAQMARWKEDGSFLQRLNRYRKSQGSGGVFARRKGE